jgi:hypothetical protein
MLQATTYAPQKPVHLTEHTSTSTLFVPVHSKHSPVYLVLTTLFMAACFRIGTTD